MSDHEKFGGILASYERSWSLAAATHEEAAEKARDAKKRVLDGHTGMPAEARQRTEMMHDDIIGKHESQGRINRRRAEHAQAGFLLHGPDEGRDSEYMKAHSDLLGMAHRCGRCRQSDEAVG